MEDIATGKITALTKNGNRKLINGTFDWAYEEEFFCRDGFRWSPDSKQISFWQIDAQGTKDYLMINNTDSIYPQAVPVEYPIAGELPSKYKIGVFDIATLKLTWMKIPDDAVWRTYVPRMEWAANNKELIIPGIWNRFFMLLDKLIPKCIKEFITEKQMKKSKVFNNPLAPLFTPLKSAI